MKLGIDFDGVMNNMLETWVEWLNKEHGTHVRVEDVTEWELSKKFPYLDKSDLFKPLNTPEFWDEVEIHKDAPAVVEKLIKEGHEIYVITSSHYKTLPYKLKRCLFAHFPFLTKENVIITYNKSLIKCDLLLDDAEHNLKDFFGIRVIYDAPYNYGATNFDYRVGSWKEFYILVQELALGRFSRPPFARVYKFNASRGGGKTAWLHQMIKDSEQVPCYVIMPEHQYNNFCRSYLERFGKVCHAKLYKDEGHIDPLARFFVDMPSTFGFNTSYFEKFKTIYLARNHLIFVADFENVHWHTV